MRDACSCLSTELKPSTAETIAGFLALLPLPVIVRRLQDGAEEAARRAELSVFRVGQDGQELLAAEHSLQLGATFAWIQRLDRGVSRVGRDLLDHEVARGSACNLGKVGDSEHLGTLAEALERVGDCVRCATPDTGVDLVEDERLAAGDRRQRERYTRELTA